MKYYISTAFAMLIGFASFSQNCETLKEESIKRISTHIQFLASDDLQGRLPGTEGAEQAAQYIAGEFDSYGLTPMGDGSGFFQNFNIADWVFINTRKTVLNINGEALEVNSDFYPMPQSANKIAESSVVYVGFGIEAPELKHNDYKKLKADKLKGNIFVMDISSPDGIHPHSAYLAYHNINKRIELAIAKGAVGVILVNQGEMASDPDIKFRAINSLGIPVIFLKSIPLNGKWKKMEKVTMGVKMKETSVLAKNVVGFVDNQAATTIIIGAHYDHLGWGADNSLYKGEPEIHNGADDNASGTAGVLELARYYSRNKDFKKANLLFIAFSGEERGLLGSSYFVKNTEFSLIPASYMINMDMIGRMEGDELAISGTGTSPEWDKTLEMVNCGLTFKTTKSGVGPSDHTSFYNVEMPVLHFFTGTHDQYHKPTDDFELINLEGELRILNMIIALNEVVGEKRLEFTATVNADSRKAPKFSVTLGIVPDYMYDGEGLKIDGVSGGKPASKAGLQAGDIILNLGDVKVSDMQSYMDALSLYKKGDSVKVIYKRGGKTQESKVTF